MPRWLKYRSTKWNNKQAGTGPSRRHIQGSKIAKRLSSVQYSFTVLENRKFLKKNFSKKLHSQKNGPSGALKSHNAEKLKGWTLWGFSTSILSQNMQKLKKTKIFIFGKKISQCRKKNWKGGLFGIFQHPFCRKTSKKMQGGPFGEFFFRKKVSQCRKKWKGESLVSPGMVCYAEKQEKPFWFSSLDQIVHFDAIIFCKTFVELFWSVRVDRKKRVTIIVAFHFMKRRLKKRFDRLWKKRREQIIIFLPLHHKLWGGK